MKANAYTLHALLAAVAWCLGAGCSPGPTAPRVSLSQLSPDQKYLAEIVEVRIPEFDRRFEIRITSQSTNPPVAETIYQSPDEGHSAERFLWSKDSRYLLLVGKDLAVGPECMTDSGERIYLLYDIEKREVRCNSNQLSTPMKAFSFGDLAGIDFGEKLKPASR